MSCLPGPRDFLNIITTKYKLLVSRCCLVLLQKVGFLSAETTHFIQKKKTVYCNSFGRKFIINDSSAVNKTMENASTFTGSLPSKTEGIALCSALISSSVQIIAGNLPTLVLFAVTKPLRRKSLFLVMNMAFADLMLGAFSLPFYIFAAGGDYQLWTAKYDSEHMVYKIFYASFDDMFLLGSYISTASISCERFYAVFWPFKHRSLSTRTYRITIFLLWSSAVLLSTSMTLLNVSTSFEASLYVFIPVVLGLTITICICNTAIWRNFQNESVVSQHRHGASRNILNYSNSFVNPIVYVLRIPEFQQALRSCCTKRRPAIKMVKTERQNREGTPRTPEIELRMLRNDPNRLQVEVEQEYMETKF